MCLMTVNEQVSYTRFTDVIIEGMLFWFRGTCLYGVLCQQYKIRIQILPL